MDQTGAEGTGAGGPGSRGMWQTRRRGQARTLPAAAPRTRCGHPGTACTPARDAPPPAPGSASAKDRFAGKWCAASGRFATSYGWKTCARIHPAASNIRALAPAAPRFPGSRRAIRPIGAKTLSGRPPPGMGPPRCRAARPGKEIRIPACGAVSRRPKCATSKPLGAGGVQPP